MVQYREQLMPLVQMNGVTVAERRRAADAGVRRRRPLDGPRGRRDHRHRRGAAHIEVASHADGILGSAVIKGQATEVIDVGHFLPMAFADWFRARRCARRARRSRCCWSMTRAFFRNMLAPVLKAAGYQVRVAVNAQEGLAALRSRPELRRRR